MLSVIVLFLVSSHLSQRGDLVGDRTTLDRPDAGAGTGKVESFGAWAQASDVAAPILISESDVEENHSANLLDRHICLFCRDHERGTARRQGLQQRG